MFIDIALDIVSCIGFYKKWKNGTHPVGYFVACLVFLSTPPFLSVIFGLFGSLCYNRKGCCDALKELRYFATAAVVTPIVAVLITGAYLILGEEKGKQFEQRIEDSWLEMNMQVVSMIKIFEILGESLPQ